MPHEPTPCSTCDFVHLDTRKLDWYRWMCVKFPRLNVQSPLGVTLEPYNRASNINLGYCPLWAARREGPIDVPTKTE